MLGLQGSARDDLIGEIFGTGSPGGVCAAGGERSASEAGGARHCNNSARASESFREAVKRVRLLAEIYGDWQSRPSEAKHGLVFAKDWQTGVCRELHRSVAQRIRQEHGRARSRLERHFLGVITVLAMRTTRLPAHIGSSKDNAVP